MAMENKPFEDVFPIENGDFPLLYWFTGGYLVRRSLDPFPQNIEVSGSGRGMQKC